MLQYGISHEIIHAERANKVIVAALRNYVHDNHKDWDVNFIKIGQAIRVANNDVTGYSPAFLIFSRNVPVPRYYYGNISENADTVVNISNRRVEALNDIQSVPTLFEDVCKRLFQTYIKIAHYYNLRK